LREFAHIGLVEGQCDVADRGPCYSGHFRKADNAVLSPRIALFHLGDEPSFFGLNGVLKVPRCQVDQALIHSSEFGGVPDKMSSGLPALQQGIRGSALTSWL
jgi:hypothetical protein